MLKGLSWWCTSMVCDRSMLPSPHTQRQVFTGSTEPSTCNWGACSLQESLPPFETLVRFHAATRCIHQQLNAIYEGASIQAYGSLSSNLQLPNSDVDLCIVFDDVQVGLFVHGPFPQTGALCCPVWSSCFWLLACLSEHFQPVFLKATSWSQCRHTDAPPVV
jgi:hypothetical protein